MQFQLAFVVSQFVLTWQLIHFCVLDARFTRDLRPLAHGQWVVIPELLLRLPVRRSEAVSSEGGGAASVGDEGPSNQRWGTTGALCGRDIQGLVERLRRADRLPSLFPLYGAVTMGSMAIVRLDPKDRWLFALPAGGFACLLALFAAASVRRVRPASDAAGRPEPLADTLLAALGSTGGVRGVVVALLVLVVAGGWLTAAAMRRFEREIDHLLVNLFRNAGSGGALGFSGQSALGSVHRRKLRSENRVMLRVYGPQPPGYMRGQVFVEYSDAMWHTVPSTRSLDPTDGRPIHFPALESNARLFAVEDGVRAERWSAFECWPDPSLATYLFTPLGTTHVAAEVNEVSVTPRHDIVRSDDLLPGHPYTAFVPHGRWREPRSDSSNFLESLTRVHPHLRRRLQRHADVVFAGCTTTAEKIRAVRRFFQNNFEYRLGIEIYGDEDPVVFFLDNRLPAHCEYFATAGALLLRMAGVPTRYVTGFVVSEPNRYSGCWIARNRDAHAWVEAFDPKRGWVVVECTPPAGVPQGEPGSRIAQAWDATLQWGRRLRVRWNRDGLQVVGEVVTALLMNGPVQLAVVLLIAVTCWQRWRLRRWKSRTARTNDPWLTELHALLERADRKAARHEFRRRADETLHQFAERLSLADLARWYREYAACRYQPHVLCEAALARLKNALDRIA
ncbi:MAG: hypothetical protein D6725_01305 [Planctomycetota bacterium]|nr:MAG: hypothetical protein D6725_01305 [Planctomycetota bacterium]